MVNLLQEVEEERLKFCFCRGFVETLQLRHRKLKAGREETIDTDHRRPGTRPHKIGTKPRLNQD